MFIYILLIILLIVIIYYFYKKSSETFEITNEIENVVPKLNKYTHHKMDKLINDEFFTEAQFHQDYIDVINTFNDWDGISPHNKQLFNVNNVPVKLIKNLEDTTEIIKIENMINDFINEVNKKLQTSESQYENTNGWNKNKFRQDYEDGFEKMRKNLGLTPTLYNKEVQGTKIKLNEFFDISKYIIETEIKYVVYIVISRELSNDQLVIKVNFIESTDMPGNIIIENIDILGFIANRKINFQYADINNFYNFDSLEENNMIDSNNILNELAYKHLIRNKLMQEQIENLSPDDQYMHNALNPYDYQSYKNTRTIYQDMRGAKTFDNSIKETQ